MTDREIDAKIAEYVMGWTWFVYADHPVKYLRPHDIFLYGVVVDGGRTQYLKGLPHFSTDVAAAWGVVERLGHRAWDFYRYPGGGWRALVWAHDKEIIDPPWVIMEADTMPMAICLAALRAVGVEI